MKDFTFNFYFKFIFSSIFMVKNFSIFKVKEFTTAYKSFSIFKSTSLFYFLQKDYNISSFVNYKTV